MHRTAVTCFFLDHHSLTETAAPVTNAAILVRAARAKAKANFSTQKQLSCITVTVWYCPCTAPPSGADPQARWSSTDVRVGSTGQFIYIYMLSQLLATGEFCHFV